MGDKSGQWPTLLSACLLVLCHLSPVQGHRTKRIIPFIYPGNAVIQFALGVALPANVNGKNVATNSGILINIDLPTNVSQLRPPSRSTRSLFHNSEFHSLLLRQIRAVSVPAEESEEVFYEKLKCYKNQFLNYDSFYSELLHAVLSPGHLMKRMNEFTNDPEYAWLLRDLIKSLILDLNCLTAVTDLYYNDLFTNYFFFELSDVPIFKVMIKENEDLLAPDYPTLSVMQQSRRKGCNTYIIFIANGDQTLRFLRFGDKSRVIDTRARYLLLRDPRLFQNDVIHLWKKIVNVLFLGKLHVNGGYELSTVPFPSATLRGLKPAWVDSWRNGKFQKNNDLFIDKTSDLLGRDIYAATFPHIPSATKEVAYMLNEDEDSEKMFIKYGGLEVQILESLSRAMNFRAVIYEPENSETEAWGRRQLNGTYSGLLGEMVSGKADIALGNFYYAPHYLELFDLSIPYTTQCFTFLTPESTADNSWKTLILPFKGYMWLGVLLALIICSFVFYVLGKFQKEYIYEDVDFSKSRRRFWFWNDLYKLWNDRRNERTGKKASLKSISDDVPPGLHIFGGLGNSLMNTYSMLLLVSLPKMPSGWSLRMFTGFWWLYCILVTVAYRASMTAILANPAQRIVIDTLDELAASPIGCGGWGEQNKKFFTTSLDSAGQRVGRKFEVIYETNEAIKRVAKGSFAYYENIYYLYNIKASQKKDSKSTIISGSNISLEGEEKDLHIMKTCVINMPISIGLQKNSPLKTRIDKFLQRVSEAGLIEKWLTDLLLNITVAESSMQKTEKKALMDLKKFVGAFVALGAGYLIGVLALLIENIYWFFAVKKNKLFDKYN